MVAYIEPTQQAQLLAADRYLNREVSYLQFNDRVLQLGEEPDIPLLERAKFLSIVAANLDEFYMVRVAGLKRQQAASVGNLSADGLSADAQLSLISEQVSEQMTRLSQTFIGEIKPGLLAAGVKILRWAELNRDQRRRMKEAFQEQIFPILTPLAVDPGHPFPYISNRSLSLAVFVKDEDKTHFARIKVPPILPRLMPLGDGCQSPSRTSSAPISTNSSRE